MYPWTPTWLDLCTDDLGQLGCTRLQAAYVCVISAPQGGWLSLHPTGDLNQTQICKVSHNISISHAKCSLQMQFSVVKTSWIWCSFPSDITMLTTDMRPTRMRHPTPKIAMQWIEHDQLHIQKYDGKGKYYYMLSILDFILFLLVVHVANTKQ